MQERLVALLEERKRLLDGTAEAVRPGSGAHADDGGNAMIEKEKHKLEVLQRRQERDMQQVG